MYAVGPSLHVNKVRQAAHTKNQAWASAAVWSSKVVMLLTRSLPSNLPAQSGTSGKRVCVDDCTSGEDELSLAYGCLGEAGIAIQHEPASLMQAAIRL
jgi:hypothetical protein